MKINCLIIRYFSFPNSVEIFSHLLVDQLMSLEVLVWVYMVKILKKLFSTAIPMHDELLPVVLKTSAMRFPFISWSNFEFEWRLGLTFTSRRITEPVRSSIISNPNSSKQFPWEAQCLWTCCTMWPSAAINVFSTTSKNWSFLCQNHETNKGGAHSTTLIWMRQVTLRREENWRHIVTCW